MGLQLPPGRPGGIYRRKRTLVKTYGRNIKYRLSNPYNSVFKNINAGTNGRVTLVLVIPNNPVQK
jgi:hypothetical protein